MIKHTKNFGVYHWDTFDGITLLVSEADTLEEAQSQVNKRYKSRISTTGADRVDIVDQQGNVVQNFSVC